MQDPCRRSHRAAALAAVLLTASLAAAAQTLPPRNLSVEVRVVEGSATSRRDAQASGTVTIGSHRRAEVSGSATLLGSATRSDADVLQRVLVLNGARATLQLAQGQLVDVTDVFWTPWGPGAAVRSQWAELVNGVQVLPRWPGGSAPVTVELAAQRSVGPVPTTGWQGAQGSLPAQWSTLSTVQVPLGEWVEVAQLQGRQATTTGGFSAATASRQRSLQLRVSLQ
jgi:hypothetical protein